MGVWVCIYLDTRSLATFGYIPVWVRMRLFVGLWDVDSGIDASVGGAVCVWLLGHATVWVSECACFSAVACGCEGVVMWKCVGGSEGRGLHARVGQMSVS